MPVAAESFVAASGASIAGGRHGLHPFWRDLAPGWTEIRPPGLQPPPGIHAYSGMALDSDGGNLYLFGGGHNDSPCNAVWSINLDRRDAWNESYTPDFAPNPPLEEAQAVTDNVNWPGAIVRGGVPVRPISRHTYKSVHWINSMRRMIIGGGSTYSGGVVDGFGEYLWKRDDPAHPGAWLNSPLDLWLYDPVPKTWQYLGSKVKDPSYQVVGSTRIYHSGRDRVYQLSTNINGNLVLHEFNPHTNTFIAFPEICATVAATISMAVDSKRDRLIVLSRYTGVAHLWAFDLTTHVWTELPAGGSVPADFYEQHQIAYVPESDCLLMAHSQAYGLRRYDFSRGEWSTIPIPNTAPLSSFTHMSGCFAHDAKRKVTFLLVGNSAVGIIRLMAYKE